MKKDKAKTTFYILCLLSFIPGYIANLVIGSLVKYGIKGLDFKYINKMFPYASDNASLFAFIFIPGIIIMYLYTDWTNRKNFSKKGKEFGSAKKGTLEEVEPFIEKETYWLNGIAVSKKEYDSFISNNEKIKTAWINELDRQWGLKNPKYKNNKESFNKWLSNYARVEINPNGTSNNMILSKDLFLGYNAARLFNKNVIVIGGSGTGKTRNLIKPNIMQLNTSFIITDPKGTILQELGTMLYKNGYDIKVFNLLDVENSMKYNPFAYVYNELDIITLSNTLIQNTTTSKGGDEFWTKAESLLYQALFAYVKKHLPEEQQNFGFIVDMISCMDVEEDDPGYMNAVDIIFDRLEKEYEIELCNDPSAREPFELKAYKEFKLAAGKTLKSILISCATRLQAFNIPQIRDLVEYDEMEIEKRDKDRNLLSCYGDHKTALFCITSDSDSSLNFLVAILYTQMFNTLMNTALKDFGGSLPVHIKCLLDEFANIGQIPKFDEIISVIRSRNISVMLVLQAKAQLKKIYKEAADTIVTNCDTEIFLGGKEEGTIKEIVASLGKETIDYINESRSYSRNDSKSMSTAKTGSELISINELKTMPIDECIVQIRTLNPHIKVKKYDITKHPMYSMHVDASDINNPLIFKAPLFIKNQRLKRKQLGNLAYLKTAQMYQERAKKQPHMNIHCFDVVIESEEEER